MTPDLLEYICKTLWLSEENAIKFWNGLTDEEKEKYKNEAR